MALVVSSLSTSGLRAVLASFPAMALLWILGVLFVGPLDDAARHFFEPLARQFVSPGSLHPRSVFLGMLWTLTVLVSGLAVMLLTFGFDNHRSLDRSKSRLARQFAWIAAYLLGAVIVFVLVGSILSAAAGRIVVW